MEGFTHSTLNWIKQIALMSSLFYWTPLLFGEPTDSKEFIQISDPCFQEIGKHMTEIIRQIQKEVAPTRSKEKVNANLKVLDGKISEFRTEFQNFRFGQTETLAQSQQSFLSYMDWYQKSALPDLDRAADLALSPSMSPEEKKQAINAIFSKLVEDDAKHHEEFVSTVNITQIPSNEIPNNNTSATYELGKMLGFVIIAIILSVFIIMFIFKRLINSPTSQIQRARISAQKIATKFPEDPY